MSPEEERLVEIVLKEGRKSASARNARRRRAARRVRELIVSARRIPLSPTLAVCTKTTCCSA